MTHQSIDLKSKSHDYQVVFTESLAQAVEQARGNAANFWLIDRNLVKSYPMVFADLVDNPHALTIDATEEQKSYEAIAPLFLNLLESGIRRDSTLIVVGGGITQDVGCFIASVLARGIRWELIPTTLLAQVDSCIGSKSSINIGAYKNQIGTFYSPHRILLPLDATDTLEAREIHSGIGEIVKFQLLSGESEFNEFLSDSQCRETDRTWIAKWIQRSLLIKKEYIEEDEFDRGRRNLLNYGHTFGHAFESATRFMLPHGVAVLFGMIAATYVSTKLDLVDLAHFDKLMLRLEPWTRPYRGILCGAPLEAVLGAMKHDKKNTAAGINCILTRGFGRMERVPVDLNLVLRPGLDAFLNVLRQTPH